ncbi:maleylpyruvate isomerase family mycothiol-dependent enzyme [Streptomyces piniterrae]|uniref:Maleylpyruvate isomerase family mycothiol-dependent enzyme n=1 Tax=Streptomyces piniterrae TaxID=2571125 RepID=A0A4U0MT58_9ACTN|nr:maleylpyruvate isomerase family mycothiol-dependent enzyme [Streptomyces piniterrae]TJZ44083.1 maleylpyruvate isomerase family mycothiol-dependent enzyme [Streptomyces piniterrae]
MEITEFVEALRLDGALFADAAEQAGPEARIPACPEWRMRDLIIHIGRVHRWATGYVTDGIDQPSRPEAAPELTDEELVPWFRDGHHRLVVALHTAPPDLTAWMFLPAPSPLAFWARRQAHETSVHRVDAQQAAGASLTPLPSAFAADGIDELLAGIHSLERSRLRTDTPRTLRVHATDIPGAVWTVHLSDAPPRTVRTSEPADATPVDCAMEGPAEELYLALWNRLPWDAVKITGDDAMLELWRERSGI